MIKTIDMIKIALATLFITSIVMVSATSIVMAAPVDTSGVDPNQQARDAVCQVNGGCPGDNPDAQQSVGEIVVRIINLLLFFIGVIAVIMVIIGGLRFVLSNGNPQAAEGARNTILYAIVGLVIALVAWGIVNFVVNVFSGGNAEPDPNQSTSSTTTTIENKYL